MKFFNFFNYFENMDIGTLSYDNKFYSMSLYPFNKQTDKMKTLCYYFISIYKENIVE